MRTILCFDFDGTIADTMPELTKIATDLFCRFIGMSSGEARALYTDTTGLPFSQQVRLLFPDHPRAHEIVRCFEDRKQKSIFSLPCFEDVQYTLRALKDRNCITAISSSTTEDILSEYCKRHDIEVDFLLGHRPGFEKGKAHFSYIIEETDSAAALFTFVGDSLNDARRARECDVSFVARLGLFDEKSFHSIVPDCQCIVKLSDILSFSN